MSERESEWQDAAAGLRMIATAMITQLVLVAFTLLTLVMVLASKKPESMQGMGMIVEVVGLAAQVMMVVGLFRFSHQPPPAPSRNLAQTAGAFGIVGLAISFYVLFVLMQVSSVNERSDYDAIESAMKAAERLPKIEVLAAVIGFVAMVLLMAAAGAVAAQVRRQDLVQRSRTAIGMVLLAAVVYVFIKLAVTPSQPGSVVAMLVMAAIVQIAAFVSILGAVRGLAEALREPPPPELPRARVIE